MSNARLALLGARPYVSAAANTGTVRAVGVLQLIDKALEEINPPPAPPPPKQEGPWEPPGGWPKDE
jgi:hypothetical protein